VVVTPGTGYGKYGEGYIRLSVTAADADIDEGLSRLSAWSRAQGPRNRLHKRPVCSTKMAARAPNA